MISTLTFHYQDKLDVIISPAVELHFSDKKKEVIFYGAGPYLAKNIKRFYNENFNPVCACDADSAKQHRAFCGHDELIVLPLKEALERYPDQPIYVTVDHTTIGNVLHYLTAECGIPQERILNYLPIEYRLGCPELETSIKFRTKRIFIRCYWRRPGIERGTDTGEDIRRFDNWREEAIAAIREGRSSPCDGCEYLKPGWYPAERQLTSLQISDSNEHSYCNFNCTYCFAPARNKPPVECTEEVDEQLDVLRHVSDTLVGKTLELQFSTGELTVHPHREEFLELFQNYRTTLFTNAGIYHEKIAELMSQGLLSLVTSMDSGTAETFHKIKNVDCYEQVCDNLLRYASTGGCIVLKYIMLPGLNDNDADADGFIDLAVRLGAVVQLSNDTRTRCALLPKKARRTVCRLTENARKHDLLVIHEREVFSAEDNAVIREVLSGHGRAEDSRFDAGL